MKAIVLAIFATLALQQSQVPLPKGQMPDLGRPTKPGDELPPFNPQEYFPGKWTFDWDVPDSALGEAGRIEGTTIYKPIEAGKSYDAMTQAKGPSGPFTLHEVLTYDKDKKTVSRDVTDSRGFKYTQSGTIGGDLGGYYNIYLESTPFTYNGHTIKLKHALRLLSPLNYKVSVTMSVDGGPFRNYGNPWWRKDPTS
ncbi:MAG TPA: hypothetical protein VFA59_16510 [Vicinamibacterales bacterium]|nr:hypothetical protein [Vicinamibacterales bacterium]